jgi:F0F1-type ATP synthase gamma subunit
VIIFLNHQRRDCFDFDSKIIENTIVQWIRDSLLPEHGARMTAMHKATDNVTELREIEIDLQ